MKDGHIHSPYCPHGSKDDFEKYVQRAMDVGITNDIYRTFSVCKWI